jgi:hypothetical protein
VNDERGLTIGDQTQHHITIDGDGNVIGDHNTVNITYQGNAVAVPSREAIDAHRRALAADLQTAARRWGGVDHYIQEEGSALPIEASPYDAGRLGAREGLLPALHRADRLLVLGGAGSGKTVSLQRLAWDLCQSPEASSIPVGALAKRALEKKHEFNRRPVSVITPVNGSGTQPPMGPWRSWGSGSLRNHRGPLDHRPSPSRFQFESAPCRGKN